MRANHVLSPLVGHEDGEAVIQIDSKVNRVWKAELARLRHMLRHTKGARRAAIVNQLHELNLAISVKNYHSGLWEAVNDAVERKGYFMRQWLVSYN